MQFFIHVALDRLLATTVQTVPLACLVWALGRFVRRLSPATRCWLWWLVALQALIGLVADRIQLPWLPHAATAVTGPSAHAELREHQVLPAAAATGVQIWPAAVFLLWISGVLLTGWSTLRHWRRVNKWLRASTPCKDTQLQQGLARAATMGLRRAPRMRLSRHIDSPLVLGHFRPVLLLPAPATFDDAEMEMVLVHELAHLRRGDLWWGCVPALARHFFFFHPFVHLAVREYGIAREASCDAAVVDAGRHSRRDYGHLLVRLGTRPHSGPGYAVTSRTFHALTRRLTMLQDTRFLPRGASIALLIVVVVAGVMPLRLVAAAAASAPSSAVAVPGTAPASATEQPDQSGAGSAQIERHPAGVKKKTPRAEAPLPVPATRESAAPQYTGERMTANFQDIDTRTLLQVMAKISGRNIVIADSVGGSVTARADNVPWDQFLDIVLRTKGLESRVQGNTIFISVAAGHGPN